MSKRGFTAAITVSTLLISIFAGTQFVNLTKANFFPAPIPSGIRIESDGAVNGTNSIQRNGNTYTFTENIHETIVILSDNVTIDGAGYNLTGKGTSSGVFIQDRTSIIIKHMQISNFGVGISVTFGYVADPKNITILENNITNNGLGIYLSMLSYDNSIVGNNITGNGKGISLTLSHGNTFRNNRLSDNEYNLWIDCLLAASSEHFVNDIDASNTVDGKPVYFWVNQANRIVPFDAGYVGLVRCDHITVQGLSLSHNGQGVMLVETNNSIITGNQIASNYYGIALFGTHSPCTNNDVSHNELQNTENIYTYLMNSVNTISDNQLQTPTPTPSPAPSPSQISSPNPTFVPITTISPTEQPATSPIPSSTPVTSPSQSPTPSSSASHSPTPTLEPTLEPTQAATPTADDNQLGDFTLPIILAVVVVVAVVALGGLIYLRKHKRN